MIRIKNYINGKLITPKNKEYLNCYNPNNQKLYALCPNSKKADLTLAINSAKKSFNKWASLDRMERAEYLFKISHLLKKEFEKFVTAESMDTGKPLALARKLDIPRSIDNLKFFASAIANFSSDSFLNEKNSLHYTLKQPLGIVGCISPWNLPLYLFTWKIAPALITGNCVIAKPSELTPMTAYLFSKICIKAKLPPGVLNIIHGTGNEIGEHITSNKNIRAISFTGSTQVGKKIAEKTAPSLKKVSLELGGKNPVIIFSDCNYKKMMKTILKSSFLNQGQICLAGSRILIEQKIYEKFKKDFINATKKLTVGDPNKNVDLGPVISETHYNKIINYIKQAENKNYNILIGRKNLIQNKKNGWYIYPTIIEGATMNSSINQNEIFGPVVTIMPFKNEKEVIRFANNSNYGLASIIWTENITKAQRISKFIESGIVWINTWLLRDLRIPFGGIKNSGIGREGGTDALNFFTEKKSICIDYNE